MLCSPRSDVHGRRGKKNEKVTEFFPCSVRRKLGGCTSMPSVACFIKKVVEPDVSCLGPPSLHRNHALGSLTRKLPAKKSRAIICASDWYECLRRLTRDSAFPQWGTVSYGLCLRSAQGKNSKLVSGFCQHFFLFVRHSPQSSD
ncbi:unnamed protein product [Rangifer tarandus platyrhynchus]|uniref:Uncharacterized protein n=1 Tax=Rangifer tarandus platyrhynchus TaxID=3082113 RepID=A0ABN8XIM6_RANTA|nr:unnamed protein product [Rangifer tarandus platyrhynchus]